MALNIITNVLIKRKGQGEFTTEEGRVMTEAETRMTNVAASQETTKVTSKPEARKNPL